MGNPQNFTAIKLNKSLLACFWAQPTANLFSQNTLLFFWVETIGRNPIISTFLKNDLQLQATDKPCVAKGTAIGRNKE